MLRVPPLPTEFVAGALPDQANWACAGRAATRHKSTQKKRPRRVGCRGGMREVAMRRMRRIKDRNLREGDEKRGCPRWSGLTSTRFFRCMSPGQAGWGQPAPPPFYL